MTIHDSRRQTGPGRLLDGTGAALEVHLDIDVRDAAERGWTREVRALTDAVGWTDAPLAARRFSGGLSLAVGAPEDALYAATELNEAAVARAAARHEAEPFTTTVDRLRALIADEADPALVALLRAAEAHGLPCLWDDEAVTLGLGCGGQSFPLDVLPAPDAVGWDTLHAVPTALVTGTNGKSTTVRLLAAMARAAGHTAGVSTTDSVSVGDETLDTGDFSGPMGARTALRDRRATLGVLEAARGGLLRRGVPFVGATAAAVTNVAADHLGDYGVETVAQLAEVKFVVAQALQAGGVLVLTAGDEISTREADRQAHALRARGVVTAWAALVPGHPRLASGGPGASVVDGHVAVRLAGVPWRRLCAVEAVPCTLGGTARHNVRNALTAVALGQALGLPDEALEAGLLRFSDRDNPGRINRFRLPNGARVVVDYAHNAHGVAAVVEALAAWPAGRRALMMSAGGDRSDADLTAMVRAALPFHADRYLLTDLPGYLRGRAPGDAPSVFARALQADGVPENACALFPDPPRAVRVALDGIAPDALALLFVLSHRDEVFGMLREAGAEPEG